MSVVQYTAALEDANRTRLARAEFKRELKAGTANLPQILRDGIPDWLSSMPAERLLICAPKVGARNVHKLLTEARLGPMQRSEHITVRQRNLLAELLEGKGHA